MTQEDPSWHERDEVFHDSGPILDKKTKVTVLVDGKKIDSFKLADTGLFKVTRSTANWHDRETAGILAMQNSRGVISYTGEMEGDYDRSKLQFEVARIDAMDQYMPAGSGWAQYFIVTGVTGFEDRGFDSLPQSEYVMTSCGFPKREIPPLEYKPPQAARFRKLFLS